VIGGNIRRLQRHADTESREYDVYERLFSENQKIDAMAGISRPIWIFLTGLRIGKVGK